MMRRACCLNEVRPRRPEQGTTPERTSPELPVSMKSGLEGRNNTRLLCGSGSTTKVSMKSGLEGRNKTRTMERYEREELVSMKSGLEGRNNSRPTPIGNGRAGVSMKSGLEGRNKAVQGQFRRRAARGLNEVRPRRPEQPPPSTASPPQRKSQ